MKFIDVRCPKCETIRRDVLLRDEGPESLLPLCEAEIRFEEPGVPVAFVRGCHTRTERVHLPGKAAGVVADSIPGGLLITNGLCNPDGSARRYDSHTEIRKEAERRGMTNFVTHNPPPGTDKSKHTVKWS